MKLKVGFSFAFINFFIFLSVIDVFAGPVIIRDNRVTDIGTTPVLGRGYTMSTNTFQSICLKDVKLTEPSYDFTYRFEEMKSDGESTKTKKTDKPEVSDPIINEGFKKYVETVTSKKGETSIREGKTYSKHRMVATIDLDSYYASVDESTTSLSDSARNLLVNNDLPGYFDSCGSYYVRSLNRRAKLVSVFEYEAEGTERDVEFEGMIESQVKSFGQVTRTQTSGAWFWKKSKTDIVYEQQGATETTSSKLEEAFKEKASKNRLTITTAGFGLGKDKEATLVSYDIESFKQAIKDAFKAMQNPLTGKVVSIEVVPWVENTEFQDYVKLNELVKIPATKDDKGITVPEKVLQPYQMKHNINENAEFLAEIKKNDRNLLNIYYKAKMCKTHFDTNWRQNGVLRPEYAESLLRNHRTGAKIKITELDSKLNEAYIETLYTKEQDFMYTGQNSASECMNAMIKNDIRTLHYRNIKKCTDLIKNMGNIESEIIDDYCMPVISEDPNK
ncbi:MAG TPA: hypothetical protein PKG60_06685 [Spirochaetota bacterium]|nr:hypothetical protein [Spirochaetota bacterium]HPS86620.1 hypothetical protein [Spirochaetota bacterium]